ncbi:IclR family transcriptional regulator [uncultured Roseobacter sp.]|uniref:IclR family transcriptional regulator n=1 Tax=uncultured Roseobacter sp. TaxID=114847 RepID=UPI00345D3948
MARINDPGGEPIPTSPKISESGPKTEKYSAPALSKGLDILELLASRSTGMKKTEVANALDRSLSEIFRMLAVLTDRNYVAYDPVTERFSLTQKMFELAHRHPPIKRLNSVAVHVMDKLASDLDQSVHLAIIHGAEILVIAQTDAPCNNNTSVRLGARIPIVYTASGAVLLAQTSKRRRADIYARSPEATDERIAFFETLVDQVVAQNYCDSPSQVIVGVHNIATPIFNYSGEAIAALTIPFVKRLTRSNSPDIKASIGLLIQAGQDISRQLGAGASEDGSAL